MLYKCGLVHFFFCIWSQTSIIPVFPTLLLSWRNSRSQTRNLPNYSSSRFQPSQHEVQNKAWKNKIQCKWNQSKTKSVILDVQYNKSQHCPIYIKCIKLITFMVIYEISYENLQYWPEEAHQQDEESGMNRRVRLACCVHAVVFFCPHTHTSAPTGMSKMMCWRFMTWPNSEMMLNEIFFIVSSKKKGFRWPIRPVRVVMVSDVYRHLDK